MPQWSTSCLEEVARNLPSNMKRHDIDHLFQIMNDAFPSALVEWPPEFKMVIRGNVNPKDCHIGAAALSANPGVMEMQIYFSPATDRYTTD